ncbi:MAG: hypothetical protein HKN51_05605 [Saprospiraceae bacterium]|nr:hypothetical protein [Saprospiraceae bacterium]
MEKLLAFDSIHHLVVKHEMDMDKVVNLIKASENADAFIKSIAEHHSKCRKLEQFLISTKKEYQDFKEMVSASNS